MPSVHGRDRQIVTEIGGCRDRVERWLRATTNASWEDAEDAVAIAVRQLWVRRATLRVVETPVVFKWLKRTSLRALFQVYGSRPVRSMDLLPTEHAVQAVCSRPLPADLAERHEVLRVWDAAL